MPPNHFQTCFGGYGIRPDRSQTEEELCPTCDTSNRLRCQEMRSSGRFQLREGGQTTDIQLQIGSLGHGGDLSRCKQTAHLVELYDERIDRLFESEPICVLEGDEALVG